MTECSALVIRASAGTGKTFSLTNHLLALLAEGIAPHEVLATTFTKKAAGEIRERLYLRLAAAASSETEARELAGHMKAPGFDSPAAAALLEKLVREQHRLQVCTLDSFFIRVARAFSLELGLPLSWRIIEDVAARALLRSAIGDAIGSRDAERVAEMILLRHQGEVRSTVHATIERDLTDLLEVFREAPAEAWKWLQPGKRLAAAELPPLIEALAALELPLTSKGEPHKSWVSANERAVACLRLGEWKKFLDNGIAGKLVCGESEFNRVAIPDAVSEAYAPLIEHAAAVLLNELYEQTVATYWLLATVEERADAQKRELGGLRFDDVKQILAERALTAESAELYYRLDARVRHLLLDEFQDTSRGEWKIIRPIVEELLAGSEDRRSFFCVGDVKQAIYGWRGGVADIFNEFSSGQWEIETQRLDRSWRSAPEIMANVNTVFGALGANPALADSAGSVSAWLEDFHPHETAHTELAGFVRLLTLPEAGDCAGEANAAAIAELVEGLRRQQPNASIAVLLRRNRAIPRIMLELKRREFEASEEGGNPVHDSPYVALILSALELADHPDSLAAAFHVAASPLAGGLGLADHADDRSRRRVSLELRRLISAEGMGRAVFHLAALLAPFCGRRDRMRLEQLVGLAYAFEHQAAARADSFVDHVRATKVQLPSGSPVRVMTIHQAKGLEFDSVILADIDSGIGMGPTRPVLLQRPSPLAAPERVVRYPNQLLRRLEPRLEPMYQEACAEELREALSVLYVALTRPVHTLTMLISPKSGRGTSLGDILLHALAPGAEREADKVLYESGAAQWFKTWKAKAAAERLAEEEEAPLVTLAAPSRRRRAERRRASYEHAAVAEMLAHAESRGARQRGVALHALFEQVEWLDDACPPAELLEKALSGLVGPAERKRLIDEFNSKTAVQEIRSILSRGRYSNWDAERLAVYNELPYAVMAEDELLSGRADRVVVGYRNSEVVGVEVIDFKTGSAENSRFYEGQLRTYIEALSMLFHCPAERVSAGLLYLDEPLFYRLCD